jgi:ribosome-associated protein
VKKIKNTKKISSPRTLAKLVAELAKNKKAEDVVILDLRKVCNFCDYFVIMTGSAEIHVKSLTEYIVTEIKKQYDVVPHHTEGGEYNRWVVIDYINVVVHIMLSEVREFYALEKIWAKGKKVSYERKSKKSVK